MARKTFHHLGVGSRVFVQHVVWEDEGLREVATFTGRVTENKPSAKCVRVDVLDCYRIMATPDATTWTVLGQAGVRTEATLSKQTGLEWGSSVDEGCWRIHPAHAQTKQRKSE
jgi:hypothetical protein